MAKTIKKHQHPQSGNFVNFERSSQKLNGTRINTFIHDISLELNYNRTKREIIIVSKEEDSISDTFCNFVARYARRNSLMYYCHNIKITDI